MNRGIKTTILHRSQFSSIAGNRLCRSRLFLFRLFYRHIRAIVGLISRGNGRTHTGHQGAGGDGGAADPIQFAAILDQLHCLCGLTHKLSTDFRVTGLGAKSGRLLRLQNRHTGHTLIIINANHKSQNTAEASRGRNLHNKAIFTGLLDAANILITASIVYQGQCTTETGHYLSANSRSLFLFLYFSNHRLGKVVYHAKGQSTYGTDRT